MREMQAPINAHFNKLPTTLKLQHMHKGDMCSSGLQAIRHKAALRLPNKVAHVEIATHLYGSLSVPESLIWTMCGERRQ